MTGTTLRRVAARGGAAWIFAALAGLAVGCRKAPRREGGGATGPRDATVVADAWGPGGPPRVTGPLDGYRAVPAGAGKYGMLGARSFTRFITTEHSVHDTDRLSVTLALEDGGAATACFGRHHTSSSSSRRYLANGKHETSNAEHSGGGATARRGTWRADGAWIEVRLTDQHDGCPFAAGDGGPAAAIAPKPVVLRCARLEPPPSDGSKQPLLACTGAEAPFTVPLGLQSWLLLGQPGVRTSASVRDRGTPLISVTPLDRAVGDDDWKP